MAFKYRIKSALRLIIEKTNKEHSVGVCSYLLCIYMEVPEGNQHSHHYCQKVQSKAD